MVLRLYQLDKVPIELFGDELDVGYQAYSILKTGEDLYGQKMPIFFHSLSEYRVPLFIYSTIPTVAIWGLNEWGVRLSAAFWGIISIIGVFLLVKYLFDEKKALVAALILSISPWHVHYSRAAFEVTMLLAFLVFATLFFLKGLKNNFYLYLSVLLFALTPYIYSTATLFMPLWVLTLVILNRRSLSLSKQSFSVNKKNLSKNIGKKLIVLLIFIIILLPYGVNTVSGKAGERFNAISIFSEKSLQDKILLAQQRDILPFGLQRFFYNKPLAYGQTFTMNYLRAFSPEFLFLNGDPNFRQSVHEMGLMYLYELIPLFWGIFLLNKMASQQKKIILGWLLIAPIPAALTYDGGFHATRNFLMLFPLVTLVAFGLMDIFQKIKNKSILKFLPLMILLLGVFNFSLFSQRYFYMYPLESWRAWNFGFKQALQYVDQNQEQYSKIYLNNTYEPSLIRFLFWTKYDPAKFHQEFSSDKVIKNVTSGFDGFQLENKQSFSSSKYYFGSFNAPMEQILKKDELFMASSREDLTNPQILTVGSIKLQKTIFSPNGEVIFYLVKGTK